MRRVSRLLLLAAVGVGHCFGTLVIVQWTPQRILLAADSLALKVNDDGTVHGVIQCKIHQEGDTFIADGRSLG
jgi:hypothetical protein